MKTDKVWFVTGASKGMGLSLVKKLIGEGYRVAATSRGSQRLIDAVGHFEGQQFLPSEFAGQLAVHVNHLNRAVKEITEKTTSMIIAERLLQEAKILLRHTEWNVSEIAYSLGFKEATDFNNFFKKMMQLTPVRFREMD